MHLLEPSQYSAAARLFHPLTFHLSLTALFERGEPGAVWADDPHQPQAALARCGSRFYLGGQADTPAFAAGLGQLFDEVIYPQGLAGGEVDFSLFYEGPAWEAAIRTALSAKHPIPGLRHYYRHSGPPAPAWREHIPQGFWVERITPSLLEQKDLGNFEDMYEEITSEIATVEEFLQGRFGFILRDQNDIAAWCMSEYNSSSACEVGIATAPEYQRRGFARIVASALIEHAWESGIREVGWDCWADNTPSIRTALSLGFEKVCDVPVFFAWYDQAANLAVNGNVRFRAGQPTEALEWFGRAFLTGRAPLWSYVSAAFAYNQTGNKTAALSCLRMALDMGFEGREWITSSEYLADLHGTPQWRSMFGSGA